MTEILQATMLEAEECVLECIKAGLVPITRGSPGIGKSELHRYVADKFKLKFIDVRLPTHDVTDLTGFPQPDNTTGKMTFLPTDMFPLETDPIPDGYDGWYIHFDELPSCRDEMQVAAYKILLDKAVHLTDVHPNAVMACSGNLESDNAIVNGLSTAMQSRLIHIEVMVDVESFLKWAGRNLLSHLIIGFINFRPDLLHSFDPQHDDHTYPCPRTYYFLSKFMKNWNHPFEFTQIQRLLMNGTIGHGTSYEFSTFCAVYKDLPTFQQMVNDPDTTPVSDKLDVQCAIGSIISARCDSSNSEPLMRYMARMPAEFQLFTVKDLIRRDPTMFNDPFVVDWKKTAAPDLFV